MNVSENINDIYADKRLLNLSIRDLFIHTLERISPADPIQFELATKQVEQFIFLTFNIQSEQQCDYTDYGAVKLARRIIELHGGTLTFNPDQDSASGFTVRLPVAEAA